MSDMQLPNEEKPNKIRVLKNGTLFDTETHRFLTGPSKPLIPKGDSEAGRALVQRRKDLVARGALLGLIAAAQADAGEMKGVKATAAHYVKAIGDGILANAVEKPFDASRALDKVLKWAQLVEQQQQASGNTYVLQLSGPVAASWEAAGIIDVEARDAGEISDEDAG